jgi:hypothetical protein
LLTLGSIYYRFFSENAPCWLAQDMGMFIECPPRVPDWAWLGWIGLLVALTIFLAVRMRAANR